MSKDTKLVGRTMMVAEAEVEAGDMDQEGRVSHIGLRSQEEGIERGIMM